MSEERKFDQIYNIIKTKYKIFWVCIELKKKIIILQMDFGM